MVTAAERRADLHQARISLLAHQVHRDLAWDDDIARPPAPAQNLQVDAIELGDRLDNVVVADALPAAVVEQLAERCRGNIDGNRLPVEVGERDDPVERAFQLADVALDAV